VNGTPPSNRPGGESPSDAALVGAAMTGHAWAQEALYRRHVPHVFALAVRLLGERDLGWDAVQNGFIVAFRKLGKLRDPAAFAPWLRKIVVRETLSMRRRERPANRNVDIEELASSEASPEERASFVRLQRWLEGVREPDRTIYLLRVVEQYRNEDIAELMNVSLATVKRKAARVEKHLRNLGRGASDE